MKQVLSILTFILATSDISLAQVPYTPFPKDSLSWHVSGWKWDEDLPIPPSCATFALNGKDTLINDKIYTEIIGLNGNKFVGIREENKKIYVYIEGIYVGYSMPKISKEILLYDFNLNIGDTMHYDTGMFIDWKDDYNPMDSYFFLTKDVLEFDTYAIVKEKGTIILANGSIRNTTTVEVNRPFLGGSLNIQWIEGLGTTEEIGLFSSLTVLGVCMCVHFNLSSIRNCNDKSGGVLYHNENAYYDCSCSSFGVKEVKKLVEVKVYPNPTNGELRITNRSHVSGKLSEVNYELRIDNVEIFDIYGRKVGDKFPSKVLEGGQPQADGVIINIAHLQAGIYFVKITMGQGFAVRKVVKN